MSIVYDYLKQIRDQKETKKVAPEVTSPTAPPVKKNAEFPLWGKVAAGILGCLLLGAGLHLFFLKASKTTVKLYRPPEKSRAVQAETPDFSFLLEGIIYNPSKPFAIIDGKMFERGGRIGDFEVVEITPDTVSLKNLKDGTSRMIRL